MVGIFFYSTKRRRASPSFYRSLVGALAIAQALVAAVVDALGADAVEKLENSEKRLRRSNTYWQNGDKS